MDSEKFLDGLIVEVADLEFLKRQSEHLRPTSFLTLAYGVKHVYIQKTLESRLPLHQLPDGKFYVFTPDEGFGYQKLTQTCGTFTIEETFSGFYSESTLNQTVTKIIEAAKLNAINHEKTFFWALFYNSESKDRATQEIDRSGFHQVEIGSFHIPGYGIIKSYRFID